MRIMKLQVQIERIVLSKEELNHKLKILNIEKKVKL